MNAKLKIGALIAAGLIVIGLAIGLTIGFAPEVVPEPEQPLYATELTEEKRAELIESMQPRMSAEWVLIPSTSKVRIATNHTAYYYGTYNGYDVVFIRGDLCQVWELRLGDELFYESTYSKMYLHRNGEFIDIKEGYYAGLITDDDVKMIAKIRRDYKAGKLGH